MSGSKDIVLERVKVPEVAGVFRSRDALDTAVHDLWNLLAPPESQFDAPMASAFWLFLSNVLQMLLMPLIMVGQNIQGRHAETRAENGLQVNIGAEREIEVIQHHVEYQNRILIAMLETLGLNLDEVVRKTRA